ncbi:M20/M25/M40 family metallo-hydrolase [Anaerocolumna jejuensis]|uniref:M20/M25/M40 family metallo-hydrolase n=1 Tax=Anaerocolumna jejuensis TaxID=259063 RepID=UPI003F7C653D
MKKIIESYLQENHDMLIHLIKELCNIPAPSHKEEKRAEFCKKWLEEQGAEGVFIDEALNVIYPYECGEERPVVIFMAHMDTVFPDLEPMGIKEEDGKLFSPGVGDDTANVAILLMMGRFLAANRPKSTCGIVICANSCEEGLGNLKGSKALVKRYKERLLQVVSFDGYTNEICNCAVGSMRYRIEIKTKGGHSYFDFGNKNAIVSLAELAEHLYEYQVPEDGSKTTYNVGMIQGGTSVNSIAQQAEMLYEIRSDNRASMQQVQAYFEKMIEEYRQSGIQVAVEVVGERPCGNKGEDNIDQKKLEQLCKKIIDSRSGRETGFTSASTDCNIPFSYGIPAVTIGLCLGGSAHTKQEWIFIDSLRPGFAIAADLILNYCEQ